MIIEAAWDELRDDVRVRRLGELAAASSAGRLLLVGGCLRDAALGLPTKDLDLVVEHDARGLAARYGELAGATVVPLGGERFAAIRIVEGGGWLDLLGLDGTTLDDDLHRRDLTVNAIALDVATGEILDPTGGRADLERRILRATHPGVFAEDPLRSLRLARLELTLPGFAVDAATEALARRAAAGLEAVARERVRDELDRILAVPEVGAATAWLDRLGFLELVLGGAGSSRWRERSPRLLPAGEGSNPADSLPAERLSWSWALLAAAGSEGPEEGRSLLARARRRELLSTASFDAAAALLAAGFDLPGSDRELRLWIHASGSQWRSAALLRAALAREPAGREDWLELARRVDALEEEELRGIVAPRPLLDGFEAQQLLGIGPGPALGAALADLRRAQVEGTVRTKAEAEALLGRRRGGV